MRLLSLVRACTSCILGRRRRRERDGGAYGIPAPRCRVTYNVGHGDAWVSALGCAHRRAPAPPIRSIYRLRRSVHGVRYSSRRERRDCDRYCTTTLCAPGLYTIHCIHFRYRPCVAVLRAAVPTAHCSSFLFVECRAARVTCRHRSSCACIEHLSEYSQCFADATLRCRRYENG